ncbi:hypothetical protein BH23DEI1_BH23DEI1_03120 [soil metagenome]
MRTPLLTILAALLTFASAVELVVYPFESQDPIVGIAIADRVAGALGLDVIGPAAAPALVVPLVAPSGFVNPAVFLGNGGPFGRNGAWLVRGVLGSRAAVTGSVRAEDEALVVELVVDVEGVDRRVVLRGPRADPGALAHRAAVVLARWLDLEVTSAPPLDLRGVDAAHARAVGLIGSGLPVEALAALDDAAENADLSARAAALRATLRGVLEGNRSDGWPWRAATLESAAVAAVVALNAGAPEATLVAFEELASFKVPVADPWLGAIAHNIGDDALAAAAFDRAAALPAYDFGLASRAAYRFSVGDADGGDADLEALAGAAERGELDAAASLAASLAANLVEGGEREAIFVDALGRAAPYLAYAFERRSFIAFDADDALGAARALAVAVELEPESDLYWTNFGWALYLLGFLERSEEASRQAVDLDPAQYIARYNLALVEVVTDRLDDSLATYREARRFDDGVDPEVIADLVVAEERYPDAVGVPFALGTMLEAAGDRDAAADAFERYDRAVAALPEAAAADPARAREARDRATALRAPLPPIAIEGDVAFRLGRRGPAVDVPRPGDPLVVSFEVVTAGESLPRTLAVEITVEDGDGEAVASASQEVDVPMGAIGFVVDVARVALPIDLEPGRYALRASASGAGLDAEALRSFEVRGERDLVRLLIGRDVAMLALETNQPLYGARDVERSESALLETLVRELRATADAAADVLPVPEEGRFAGRSGGEIFRESTPSDVADFIAYLLEEGAQDTSFTFVDGYADWAVAGAPAP